jgi:hypothetical protein
MAKLTQIWLSILIIAGFKDSMGANKGKPAAAKKIESNKAAPAPVEPAKETPKKTPEIKKVSETTKAPMKKNRVPYDRSKSINDNNIVDVALQMLLDSLLNRLEPNTTTPKPSNLHLNVNINLEKGYFINFNGGEDLIGRGTINQESSGDFSLEVPTLKEEISWSGNDILDIFLIPAVKLINTAETRYPVNISKDADDYMVVLASLCEELLGEKRTFPEEKVDSLVHLSDKIILLKALIENGSRFLINRLVLIISKNILEKLNKNHKALSEVKQGNIDLEAKIDKVLSAVANELLNKNTKFNQLLDKMTSHIHVLAIPTGPTSKDRDMEKTKTMIKEESITKYYSELFQTLPDKDKEEAVVNFGKIKTRGEIDNFKPYVSKTFSGVSSQVIGTKFMDEATLNQVIDSNDDFVIIYSAKNLSNDKPGNFIYIIPKYNKVILKNIEYSTPLLGYRNFQRLYKTGSMAARERQVLGLRLLLHMILSSIQSDMNSLQEMFNLKARIVKKEKEQIKETTENLFEINQQKLLEFVQNNPFLLARIQELYSLNNKKPTNVNTPKTQSTEEDEDLSDEDSVS